MALETRIEHAGWDGVDLAGLGARAVAAVLTHFDLDPEACEISLLACDDGEIATLNAEFRGKPVPTNVLSWPAQTLAPPAPGQAPVLPVADAFGETELGDIAIAYETCVREAELGGKPLADHATHLIVHATLHLLGYDHERDQDATLMEALETRILGKLGLSDPYEDSLAV